MWMKKLLVCSLSSSALVACTGASSSDAGDGALTVLLEAEATITEGLDAGTAGEDVQDGWTIRFDRYVVVIGDVDLHLATDASVERGAPELYAVDLTQLGAAGLPLWELDGLQAGEWQFNYALAGARESVSLHTSVMPVDFDAMSAADATYLIAGTMSQGGGQSCPPSALAKPGAATSVGVNAGGDDCFENPSVTFRWALGAPTAFGPCEIDEVPGFSVAADTTTTVAATIHGDHVFFNGFPEGGEGGIMRLAQWLADCDLDLDGEVTETELAAIGPADLAELDSRFQLGGSPITPLESMWDYVTAQLKTQGHFQGEGECPYDGVAHAHE